MNLFFRFIVISLMACLPLPTRSASLIPICKNINKSIKNCEPRNILFATYSTNNNVMKYKVDRGGIGEINELDAKNFADNILGIWEAESGIDFQSEDDGFIEEDVDDSNYDFYLNNTEPLGYSPVIWDQTGSLINDLYGKGSKDHILGFAGATFYKIQNNLAEGIIESQSVFNGFLFDGKNTGEDRDTIVSTFQSTILHEFGHMFGLDHTQSGNNDDYIKFLSGEINLNELNDSPVMFPVSTKPNTQLKQDDISAVRLGYPKGDEDLLFGTIKGNLKQFGSGVQGANVVAYLIDDDNPRARAVACPSDVDGARNGNFTLPHLIPGNYIIKAEPININFIGGSSIGFHDPISSKKLNESFYMGEGVKVLESEDLDTGIEQAFTINVSAGSITNINFNLDLASFKTSNLDFSKSIRLRDTKTRIIKLGLINLNPTQSINLKLSTEYPELVKFLPNEEISFHKRLYTVRIKLSSYQNFLTVFPEIEKKNIYIPLKIEDLDTGYILDSKSLRLY
ncbi:MAG: hypothetical protein RLZZ361_971 [Cyanobacteriota bacterium]